MTDKITNVIASKIIYKNTEKIEILLGLPLFCPESENYFCEFQVVGAGDEKIRKAGGVSSFQAMECAILMVNSLAETYTEH